jgi:hypothetical protein
MLLLLLLLLLLLFLFQIPRMRHMKNPTFKKAPTTLCMCMCIESDATGRASIPVWILVCQQSQVLVAIDVALHIKHLPVGRNTSKNVRVQVRALHCAPAKSVLHTIRGNQVGKLAITSRHGKACSREIRTADEILAPFDRPRRHGHTHDVAYRRDDSEQLAFEVCAGGGQQQQFECLWSAHM